MISAREKLVKPDERLYRLALERFGLRPEESLFIDDAQANVEGARAVGMAALRFDGDVGRIRAEMKKLGLLSGTGSA